MCVEAAAPIMPTCLGLLGMAAELPDMRLAKMANQTRSTYIRNPQSDSIALSTVTSGTEGALSGGGELSLCAKSFSPKRPDMRSDSTLF